jgi:hypothetical protein
MNWNKFNAGKGKNIALCKEFTTGIANINTLLKKSFSINTFFIRVYLLRIIGNEQEMRRNLIH